MLAGCSSSLEKEFGEGFFVSCGDYYNSPTWTDMEAKNAYYDCACQMLSECEKGYSFSYMDRAGEQQNRERLIVHQILGGTKEECTLRVGILNDKTLTGERSQLSKKSMDCIIQTDVVNNCQSRIDQLHRAFITKERNKDNMNCKGPLANGLYS